MGEFWELLCVPVHSSKTKSCQFLVFLPLDGDIRIE
jgi:hypothetical protein